MKNVNKVLELDDRGRITLPKNLREGVSSYALIQLEDGSLKLVPQKTVSLKEAQLLESLSRSIEQYKVGQVEDIPKEWLEIDD